MKPGVPRDSVSVLHVPYTFFPDAAAGTEIYVTELIAAMSRENFRGMVAAPGPQNAEYDHDGIAVYRFQQDARQSLAYAYGEPDEIAAESFRRLVQRLRPDIVHMHAHTAAVSERLAEIAHETGAQLVFTYHTPTISCLRGTMMQMGTAPCDGVLDATRCTVCTLQEHGLPAGLGNLLARLPEGIGTSLAHLGLAGPAVTALRMRRNAAGVHRRFLSLMAKADCVIAVCQWVKDVLIANGVPENKVALCRQGFGGVSKKLPRQAPYPSRPRGEGPLRLAYFGRIDPVKGVDIVIDALKLIPGASVLLDIYGIVQPGSETYAAALKASADARIRFQSSLPRDALADVMAEYDFVVIPSRWLETGPLVVYEAFATGTPVLGSRLGGIAELISDDVDGILVKPDDPKSWATVISGLISDVSRNNRLRSGIRPPRTMMDVATEMAEHYSRLPRSSQT
jgi:glycosyltransferase involved in cell wall biosynthesis